MFDQKIKIPASAFNILSDLLPGGTIEGDGYKVDFSPVKKFVPDWRAGTITLSPPAAVSVVVKGVEIETTISYLKKSQDQNFVYLEVDNSPVDLKFVKGDQ